VHVSSAVQAHQYLPRRVDTIRSTCKRCFECKCIPISATFRCSPVEGFRGSSWTSAQSGSTAAPSQLNVTLGGRCIVSPFPHEHISIGNIDTVLVAARDCARKDDGRGLLQEWCSVLYNATRPRTSIAWKPIAEILHANVNSLHFVLGLMDCMGCVWNAVHLANAHPLMPPTAQPAAFLVRHGRAPSSFSSAPWETCIPCFESLWHRRRGLLPVRLHPGSFILHVSGWIAPHRDRQVLFLAFVRTLAPFCIHPSGLVSPRPSG